MRNLHSCHGCILNMIKYLNENNVRSSKQLSLILIYTTAIEIISVCSTYTNGCREFSLSMVIILKAGNSKYSTVADKNNPQVLK